jgi:hypothetical protein
LKAVIQNIQFKMASTKVCSFPSNLSTKNKIKSWADH